MFEYSEGATPLDPDEALGLKPKHIVTQSQLNEFEYSNILEAEQWLSRQNFSIEKIASSEFAKLLHRRMFGKTWKWAGHFRKSNKNIGVDKFTIEVELRNLFDDLRFQIENESYELIELAARFHHRLVWIHPFPNGNGRHARMMTDIVLLTQQQNRLSWGSADDLIKSSDIRDRYIAALRTADKLDYEALIEFIQD